MKVTAKRFRKAVEGVRNGDPFPLAEVLLQPAQLLTPPFQLSTKRKQRHNESFQDSDGTDWSSVLNAWLDACQAASEGQVAQCCAHQSELHSEFNQRFQASKGNLFVPALHSVCKASHRIAAQAHTLGDTEKLQQAASLLQDSYSKTSNDRTKDTTVTRGTYELQGSKKVGTLGVVNELFALYFVLNTLRLCNNLIKPVEAKQLHMQGTSSEMVTYRYYAGRLSLFEDNFASAEENLDYALQHCHKDAVGNKRRILRYLIPVKVFRGRLPANQLLQRYNLIEFMELCAAIRMGDLKKFNTAMRQHEYRFIRQGTYLLLERCKTLCYRNLLKRIQCAIDNKPHIPTEQVMQAFAWLEDPVGVDEAECIIANMISTGLVRGYIHHGRRLIVLSKRDPFPKTALMRN